MATVSVRWLNGDSASFPHCESARQLQLAVCNKTERFLHEVFLLDANGVLLNADDPCPECASVIFRSDDASPSWTDLCDDHKEDRTAFLRACARIPDDSDIDAYFFQKCLSEDTIAVSALLEKFPREEDIDVLKHFKIAVQSMRFSVVQVMLDNHRVMESMSVEEKNKLFLQTATQNAPHAAYCLLTQNADPNALTQGRILHHICSQISPSYAVDYLPLLQTLLLPQYRLNVGMLNSGGDSALLLAIANFLPSIALYLIDARASVNRANNRGLTPLHMAVLVGNETLVATLVKWKADVNAQDHNDFSVLDVAADRGERAIQRQLVSLGAHVRRRRRWLLPKLRPSYACPTEFNRL